MLINTTTRRTARPTASNHVRCIRRSQLPVLDALSRRTGRLPRRAVRAPGSGGTEGEAVPAETGRSEVRRTRGVLDHADARSAAPTSAAATGATRTSGTALAAR